MKFATQISPLLNYLYLCETPNGPRLHHDALYMSLGPRPSSTSFQQIHLEEIHFLQDSCFCSQNLSYFPHFAVTFRLPLSQQNILILEKNTKDGLWMYRRSPERLFLRVLIYLRNSKLIFSRCFFKPHLPSQGIHWVKSMCRCEPGTSPLPSVSPGTCRCDRVCQVFVWFGQTISTIF